MRQIRAGLGLATVILAGLLGCTSTDSQLRPPKPVEEFNVPPENDPRYTKPIEYPKDQLYQDAPKKTTKTAPAGGMTGPRTPGQRY